MHSTTFTHSPANFRYPSQPAGRRQNPWVSDHVLLGLSLWWVQNGGLRSTDLPSEVGVFFRSLQQQLQ